MIEILQQNFPKTKLLIIIGLMQLGTFGAGLYSGHTFWPKEVVTVASLDYTTAEHVQPKASPTNNTASGQVANTGTECFIKGSKSRIYHLPGGAFYERTTNPAACFNSEAEAQAAGFTKSSR